MKYKIINLLLILLLQITTKADFDFKKIAEFGQNHTGKCAIAGFFGIWGLHAAYNKFSGTCNDWNNSCYEAHPVKFFRNIKYADENEYKKPAGYLALASFMFVGAAFLNYCFPRKIQFLNEHKNIIRVAGKISTIYLVPYLFSCLILSANPSTNQFN